MNLDINLYIIIIGISECNNTLYLDFLKDTVNILLKSIPWSSKRQDI